jgi:hypothetical protein
MFTMANGPRGEHLEVWYAATPDGARSGSISLTVREDQITPAAYRSQVLGKYGAPTKSGWGEQLLYCSKGEINCVPWQNKKKAYLDAFAAGAPMKIFLTTGTDAQDAAEADYRKALDARALQDARSAVNQN